MLRMILDDYKRQGKEQLKRAYASLFLVFLWLFCFFPMTTFKFDSAKDAGIYYLFTMPMFLAFFLSLSYPNRMSTTLLLCPLTREEKLHYIQTAYRLRVVLPLLLYLIASMPLLAWGWLELPHFTGMLLCLFSYVVTANLYTITAKSSNGRNADNLPKGFSGWWGSAHGVAFLTMMILVSAQTDRAHPVHLWEIGIIVSFLLIQCLIMGKLLHTYYKPVMEYATQYDGT